MTSETDYDELNEEAVFKNINEKEKVKNSKYKKVQFEDESDEEWSPDLEDLNTEEREI